MLPLDSTAHQIDRLVFLGERVVKAELWRHTLMPHDADSAFHLGQAHLPELNDVLHKTVAAHGGDFFVKTGFKPHKSIMSKLDRWRAEGTKRGVDTMADLTRGTIVTHTAEEAAHLSGILAHHAAKYDVKEYGEDKAFGYYGSHHLDLRLPSGHVSEVQVMPAALFHAKHALHKIYSAQRDDFEKGIDNPMMQRQRRLSKLGYQIANKRLPAPANPNVRTALVKATDGRFDFGKIA